MATRVFFRRLLHNTRYRTQRRNQRGRQHAHQLTHQHLEDQWRKQHGTCYYTRVPLCTVPKQENTASLERLDDRQGYTPANIVFVHPALNTSGSWNRQKLQRLQEPVAWEHERLQLLREAVTAARAPPVRLVSDRPKRRECWDWGGARFFKCTRCQVWKHEDGFYARTSHAWPMARCKPCELVSARQRGNGMRQFLLAKLRGCRRSCQKRNKTRPHEHHTVTIDLQFLLDQILKQEGKCWYTQVWLQYTPGSDFMCSIERLDKTQGYHPENVVLVAWECNNGHGTMNHDLAQRLRTFIDPSEPGVV